LTVPLHRGTPTASVCEATPKFVASSSYNNKAQEKLLAVERLQQRLGHCEAVPFSLHQKMTYDKTPQSWSAVKTYVTLLLVK
jgi:hypothetical protein